MYLCSKRNQQKKEERSSRMGRKIANYTPDKELTSRIYKELKKHNRKKIEIKIWFDHMNE
jgi:hypothetical protein